MSLRPEIAKVHHLGTILSLELRTSGDTSYTNELRSKIFDFFMSRDLHIRPLGNIIYLIPPYVISEEDLKRVYQSITDFLNIVEE